MYWDDRKEQVTEICEERQDEIQYREQVLKGRTDEDNKLSVHQVDNSSDWQDIGYIWLYSSPCSLIFLWRPNSLYRDHTVTSLRCNHSVSEVSRKLQMATKRLIANILQTCGQNCHHGHIAVTKYAQALGIITRSPHTQPGKTLIHNQKNLTGSHILNFGVFFGWLNMQQPFRLSNSIPVLPYKNGLISLPHITTDLQNV